MKTNYVWLAASIALNVVLATLYLQSMTAEGRIPGINDNSFGKTSMLTSGEGARAMQISEADLAAIRMALPEALMLKQRWGNLDTSDLKHLLTQLRERGFPEPIVRRILRQLVKETFQLGAHQARYSLENPFWKDVWGNEATKKDLKTVREARDFLKELFGADAAQGDNEIDAEMMALSGLPPDKYLQVIAIVADYQDLTSDLRSEAMVNGIQVFVPGELEKLQFLERKKREDLQRVLSSLELEDYLMRTSLGADWLRRTLAGFQPSENEFKNIFRAMEQRVAIKGGSVGDPSKDFQLYSSAMRELQKDLTSVLGPERAAEYTLATDPQTASLTRLLARLELPLGRAKEITSLQTQTMSVVTQVRANSGLSAQDKQIQLTALQSETRQKITGLLGERGAEAYQQSLGRWLTQIVSPTNKTASPPPR